MSPFFTGSAQSDRDALLEVYRTTHGQSWAHHGGWRQNADDFTAWFGVNSLFGNTSWFGVTRVENNRVLAIRSQEMKHADGVPVGYTLRGTRSHATLGMVLFGPKCFCDRPFATRVPLCSLRGFATGPNDSVYLNESHR